MVMLVNGTYPPESLWSFFSVYIPDRSEPSRWLLSVYMADRPISKLLPTFKFHLIHLQREQAARAL